MGFARDDTVPNRDDEGRPASSNRRRPGTTSPYVTRKFSGSSGEARSIAGYASTLKSKTAPPIGFEFVALLPYMSERAEPVRRRADARAGTALLPDRGSVHQPAVSLRRATPSSLHTHASSTTTTQLESEIREWKYTSSRSSKSQASASALGFNATPSAAAATLADDTGFPRQVLP